MCTKVKKEIREMIVRTNGPTHCNIVQSETGSVEAQGCLTLPKVDPSRPACGPLDPRYPYKSVMAWADKATGIHEEFSHRLASCNPRPPISI